MQDAQMIWYHFEVRVRAVKTWVSTAPDRVRAGIQLHVSTQKYDIKYPESWDREKNTWTHVFVKLMFLRDT